MKKVGQTTGKKFEKTKKGSFSGARLDLRVEEVGQGGRFKGGTILPTKEGLD